MGIIGSFQGYVDSPLYLYNKGVWGSLSSPGVSGTNTDGYYREVRNYSTYFEVYCRIGRVTDTPCVARLNSTINLSNYNYIKASINNRYGIFRLGVSTSASTTSVSGLTCVVTQSGYGSNTIISNVSALSGEYYIYFALNSDNNGDAKSAATDINTLYLSVS